MNSVYGKTAVAAAQELQKNIKANPRTVWHEKVCVETDKASSQNKGCPKITFLTLCGEGHIKGVPASTQIRSANAEYTRQMVQEIKAKKGKINSKKDLWDIVKHPKPTNENGQSSVIFALLENDLLEY